MLLVLAICNKDAELAIANLEWQEELAVGKSEHDCLISYEESTRRDYIDKARAIASRIYRDVRLFLYPDSPVKTWPQAPNWAWQNTARFIPLHYKTPWLWLEADAIPLKPGWLERLDEEYLKAGKPLMGAVIEGVVPGSHINGVAVYPADVAQITIKGLLCEKAAWDVVMAAETVDQRHNASHLIHHCWGIKDGRISQTMGEPASFKELQNVYDWVDLNAVLCHRCKDTSLIHWLRVMRSTEFNVPQLCPQQADTKPSVVSPAYQPCSPVEIFIVSCERDLPWLEYCLKSIKKFCTRFSGITLVVPEQERSLFKRFVEEYGVRLHGNDEPPGKGHLAHMWAECCADHFVPVGALARPDHFVLHVDSDCVFKMPTTPLDYFHDGKPIYIIRSYESLYDPVRKVVSDCAQWKPVAERALGFPVHYYTMCRMPTITDLSVLPEMRKWIEGIHDRPFRDFILDGKNDFPPHFSEYPTIGAFAYEFFRDHYHWIDSAKEVAPVDRLYQFHSWSGLTPKIREQIESWLR